jgi:hypothetical protein
LDKVVRDGKVAVLISPGYGAGWSSWSSKELLFDPKIVAMVEAGVNPAEYCEETYGGYFNADDLTVVWVDQGREFIVEEYDGFESLVFKDEVKWITA